MTRLLHGLIWLASSFAFACTVTTERPPAVATASAPPPPTVAPPEPGPAPPTEPTVSKAATAPEFRKKVERAIAAAKKDGWLLKKSVEIPGRSAAIVLYEASAETAPAFKAMRAEAIGASGAPYTLQSGVIDVVETAEKSLLWNLTGAGPRFVVLHLTRCEPQCGIPSPVVMELGDDDSFSRRRDAPECPTCMQDADRDGIPELLFRMIDLKIAPCSRASCGPETALLVQVRGLESWDGQRFARNLSVFEPLYRARLEVARAEVQRVKKATKKKNVCPLSALRVAAELFVYSRLTGADESTAFKEADKLMAGYSTDPCRTEFDLLAAPRTWIELRSELVAKKLPVLDAQRKL